MNAKKISVYILMAATALIVMIRGLRPGNDADVGPEILPSDVLENKVSTVVEPEIPNAPEPAPKPDELSGPDPEPLVPEQMEEPKVSIEEATKPILHLFPEWLLESGDVRRERVQVAGRWVERVRSRYAWSNGSQVEVEVSDLGSDAAPGQFKALGFDFELQAETTNGNLRIPVDGDDYVSNLEYSEDDGSGQVQYIVAGRYLLEVQLENLPLDSFQALEDRDGLFAALQQYAAAQAE